MIFKRKAIGYVRIIATATVCLSLVALALGVGVQTLLLPATRTVAISNGQLGRILVAGPPGEPLSFVIVLSDTSGITSDVSSLSSAMVAKGAAVVTLSTPQLLATLDAHATTGCHYALGLFEDISQAGQRALNRHTYTPPVIVGLGEGGALAYVSAAQAPPNTVAGAVSVGFTPILKTRIPFCAGASFGASADGFHYNPVAAMAGRWVEIATGEGDAVARAFAAAGSYGEIRKGGSGRSGRFTVAVDSAFEISRIATASADQMPVKEMPSAGADTLMIFYSGDGGWRDIDMRIAKYLNRHGVAVLGIDSFRYLWTEKSSAEIGSDLDRLVASYRKRWNIRHVALAGYSMGAGILPFAWARASDETRSSINLIAMLSLDPQASFQVSAAGFLGLATPTDVDIGPAAKGLPHERVVCFYGADEHRPEDSGCLVPEMQGATLIERPGGHHFDGNYEPIAQIILQRLNGGSPLRGL
jgi:type IV secretory pathway VirJ component